MSRLGQKLLENEGVLTKEYYARYYAVLLLDCGQDHLFDEWDEPGTRDDEKLAFLKQVEALHAAYPGGLNAYCTKARSLLYDMTQSANPYNGYVPTVPSGAKIELGSEEYLEREKKGSEKLGKTGFVLVAGSLGERLGFSGIKLELPTESTHGHVLPRIILPADPCHPAAVLRSGSRGRVRHHQHTLFASSYYGERRYA